MQDMGWEIIHDDGQKQCTMKVGNVGGIIIRNRAGYAGAPGATNRPTITGLINAALSATTVTVLNCGSA